MKACNKPQKSNCSSKSLSNNSVNKVHKVLLLLPLTNFRKADPYMETVMK